MRACFCRAALEGMCKITAADVIGPALLYAAETGWHKRRQGAHAYLVVILFRKSKRGQIEPQERGISRNPLTDKSIAKVQQKRRRKRECVIQGKVTCVDVDRQATSTWVHPTSTVAEEVESSTGNVAEGEPAEDPVIVIDGVIDASGVLILSVRRAARAGPVVNSRGARSGGIRFRPERPDFRRDGIDAACRNCVPRERIAEKITRALWIGPCCQRIVNRDKLPGPVEGFT